MNLTFSLRLLLSGLFFNRECMTMNKAMTTGKFGATALICA